MNQSAITTSLREIDLNITDRCNLKCKYCSVPVTPVTSTAPELSLEIIGRLFSEFDDMKVNLVRITGGEPFVRDDICQVLVMAGHCNFRSIVLTNGTALKRDHIHLIKELPSVECIAFSIDGVSASHHNASRGHRSAFSRVEALVDYCTEQGVEHSMMTVVTVEVVGRMCELVEFAAQHNMRQIRFIVLGFTGAAVHSPHSFPNYRMWSEGLVALTLFLMNNLDMPETSILFPHEDPVPVELYAPLKRAGLLEALDQVWGIPWQLHGGPLRNGTSWCHAGKHNLTILPNGDVFGCDLMRNIPALKAGSVLESTVRDLFENSTVLRHLRNAPQVNGCASYDDTSRTFSCGQCRAGAHILGHSGSRRVGRLIPPHIQLGRAPSAR